MYITGISREHNNGIGDKDKLAMKAFTKEELEEALRAIESTISKCEKVQPKLKQGTSQYTLLIRRIQALNIASALIKRELGCE